MNREDWPKLVTAARCIAYNPAKIAEDWEELNGAQPEWEDVMELIRGWAEEDLRSPISSNDAIWLDDAGHELPYMTVVEDTILG